MTRFAVSLSSKIFHCKHNIGASNVIIFIGNSDVSIYSIFSDVIVVSAIESAIETVDLGSVHGRVKQTTIKSGIHIIPA